MTQTNTDPPFAPRRELGRTGFAATALGIGDLADRTVPIETCVATPRRALDAGLNVIDTAPNYEDSYSEEIVGRAVREVRRDSVFVIDKVDRHEQPVGPQIDGSLGRLGLGHADLFVFHNLSSPDVFERLCHPGSGFDQFADAVKAGKCRFRGISSHDPDVLRAALTAGYATWSCSPSGRSSSDNGILRLNGGFTPEASLTLTSGGLVDVLGAVTSPLALTVSGGPLSADRIAAPALSVINGGVVTSPASTSAQVHALEVEVAATVKTFDGGTHFDAASQIELGERFAAGMAKSIGKP